MLLNEGGERCAVIKITRLKGGRMHLLSTNATVKERVVPVALIEAVYPIIGHLPERKKA